VFPCNPKNKQPLLAAKKDGEKGRQADQGHRRRVGRVDRPRPDRRLVEALAAGADRPRLRASDKGTETPRSRGLRLFVLDFDPRTDPDTGEVWTLERLKRETEAQLGCALPNRWRR
jgi:putative DNA primase/helicase